MGNLSNLYISQSFISLIHLGSDNTASGVSTQLEDGLGNGIGIYVNTSGSVSASSYSGSVNGIGNVSAFSTSVDSRLDNLELFSSSLDATFATDAQLNASSSTLQSNINTKLDTASFNTFSSSNYQIEVSQSQQISASFASSSAYSASLQSSILALSSSISSSTGNTTALSASIYQTDATQSFQITANALTASNSLNSYSSSQSTLNNTLSSSIATNSSSIGLLQTFSSSQYKSDSSSFDSRIDSLEFASGGFVTTASFNAYTSSNDTKVNNLTAQTASYAISSSVKTVTDGLQTQINGLSTTASVNTLSASIFQTDATQSNNINSLTALTASIAYTNVNNTFGGTQTFNNIAVNGTASIAYLQTVTGSAKIIGDAFIILNNDTPTERYAGIIVVDSGSANTTASFQFDGLTNDWFYEYTGSDALNYGVTLFGPEYGTKGSPIYNTANTIVKGDGGHHIVDSNITDNGSIVTINSNTNITGSLTASGLKYPLVDNGEKSFIQTDGNGNLSLQYVDTIFEAFYAGESVPKGTPLYFSGSQGANPIARAADASNPAKMPVVVVANVNLTAGTTYEGIVLGLIEGIDLTGYTAGQTVYVAEGGGWSTSLPSGSNSITQVLGVVTKGGNGGKGLVLNPGPAQLPGLREGYVWVGNGSNQPITVATSSFIDTFDSSSLVTTASFNAYTQSTNDFTASITSSYNATSSSLNTVSSSLLEVSGAFVITSASLNTVSSSLLEVSGAYVATSASLNTVSTSVGLLQTFSGSEYKADSSSFNSRINAAGGTTVLLDEGTILGNATAFNFIGSGVTATLSAGTASVTIPGGSAPAGTVSSSQQIIELGFLQTSSFNAYTQSTNDFTASITASFNSLSSSYVATSQSFNDLSSSFLLVSASTLTFATTGSNNFIGNQRITGSLILSSSAVTELQVIGAVELTGSVAGNITALSVTSNTASIDFNLGSFFTLTIPSSTITYITGSNLKPGQTANIILTQQVTTGSVRFESTLFKFPSGSINTGSAIASAVDMVSVASVNSTTLFSVTANRLI